MAKKEISEDNFRISYLVRRKFPDADLLDLYYRAQYENPEFDYPKEGIKLFEDIRAFEATLTSKSPHELYKLVRREQKKELAEKERIVFNLLNDKEGEADFAYWAKMPYWRFEEAVALSFGRNPEKLTQNDMFGFFGLNNPLVVEYERMSELARRAFNWDATSYRIKPDLYATWAVENDIAFPIELAEKIIRIDSATEHSTPSYVPPYMQFMYKAICELDLSADKRVSKKTIEGWLEDNWPSELGDWSKTLGGYMATMLRQPEHMKGGNGPWKSDKIAKGSAPLSNR